MLTLNESLATYYAIEQQKVGDITAQAQHLQQTILKQLCALQIQELGFIERQQQALDVIQSCLAEDARSLLSTAEFAAFVQALYEAIEGAEENEANPLQITSEASTWQLHKLPVAVRLTDIETVQEKGVDVGAGPFTSYETAMGIEVGSWQQALYIPTAIVDHAPPHDQNANSGWARWQAVFGCLQAMNPPIPLSFDDLTAIAPCQHLAMMQELSFLMVYTSELFTLSRFAARLGLLQNLIPQR